MHQLVKQEYNASPLSFQQDSHLRDPECGGLIIQKSRDGRVGIWNWQKKSDLPSKQKGWQGSAWCFCAGGKQPLSDSTAVKANERIQVLFLCQVSNREWRARPKRMQCLHPISRSVGWRATPHRTWGSLSCFWYPLPNKWVRSGSLQWQCVQLIAVRWTA